MRWLWLRKKNQTIIADCFLYLSQLIQEIFSCFIAGDYHERHFFYEQQFHKRRKNFLITINLLRRVAGISHAPFLNHLETCYEIASAIGLLLYRIKDHSTFDVARNELIAVSDAITIMIRYLTSFLLKKNFETVIDSLAESIQQLESLNRSTLQVVASDPLAFVLFIRDLYELDDRLMHLSTEIGQLK